VNDRGQVVGVARTASGDSHAFLYSGGAMLDLNDLVEPGTPWPIIHADGINNLGQIAATAYGGGTYRALRLDPINPTATEVEDASAAGGSAVDLEARLTDGATAAPITSAQLTFTVDGTAVGDATTDVDGIARLPVAAPNTQGAYDIEASFEGDAMHTFSMGSATLYVQCSPTSVYVTDRTGTISEQVVLRAYLRRTADGQWLDGKPVGFTIEGTPVGAGETGATGTSGRADLYWTISEGPAIRSIAAEFPGDASNLPSSGSATLTCLSWATKMATFNRTAPITDRTELKCRLLRSDNVPLYNKSVRFSVDGTFVIARPTNTQGYASYPYYTVPDGAGAGTRTILSEWPGKGGYLPVSKTATLTVLKAIPYIWVLPKTIPQGSIANLYAYFRRLYDYQKQIGKTVDFRIDGTVVQTVVTDANGVARYLYPTTEPVGVHTIRCEFYGDAWVDPGYGEGSLTIY
jgi:probable HAF family extracellular repeat protein